MELLFKNTLIPESIEFKNGMILNKREEFPYKCSYSIQYLRK